MADQPRVNKALLIVGGVVAIIAIGLGVRSLMGSSDPYSTAKLSENITIRCEDTGDEWVVVRARLEQQLRRESGQIDPNHGLVNPKTGKPTGFPVDRDDWMETVERINERKLNAGRRDRE